jgi:asparagine synthase (glutamine-hydrolysing)
MLWANRIKFDVHFSYEAIDRFMCGIVAIASVNGARVDLDELDKMVAAIHHRGPNSSGIRDMNGVAFGFRRLSILDLSDVADQPMTSADGRFTIVFNGEIYNFIELRMELENFGYTFRSTGDTEVLLNAFIQWGWDCLPKLNGMWAFLIYDNHKRILFGSRDRFGIKPLFFHRCASHILFGSEIKAIRVNKRYQGDVNWNVATDFLIKRKLDCDERTFFTGIKKIGAGTAFEVDVDGRMRSWQYWTIPSFCGSDSADPRAEYSSLFSDSVRLRLRSDVPLGVFLSGGLD